MKKLNITSLPGFSVVAAEKLALEKDNADNVLTVQDSYERIDLPKLMTMAEIGDPNAQYELSVRYHYGKGIQESGSLALKWLLLAAVQRHAPALNSLGYAYNHGEGLSKNPKLAVKYYRMAAEQGDSLAALNLGVAYESGEGVKEDNAMAVKWYRLAACKKFGLAQNNLGKLYEEGKGVNADNTLAYMWYDLARDNGDAYAGANLEKLASVMSNADIAKALRLEARCIESEYKHCGY